MKPSFALDFRDGLVTLLHRTSRGWSQVGFTAFDAPDFAEALGYMRSTALGLSPRGITTKLIIPNDQILYTTVHAPGPDAAKRRRQIKAGLEGRTPYAVEDLVYDVWGTGPDLNVAVIARETLAEAESFATEHRFNPVSFVGVPDNGVFLGEPFFGPSALAATLLTQGEKVERDLEAVTISARDFLRAEPKAKPPTPLVEVEALAAAVVAEAEATVAVEAAPEIPAAEAEPKARAETAAEASVEDSVEDTALEPEMAAQAPAREETPEPVPDEVPEPVPADEPVVARVEPVAHPRVVPAEPAPPPVQRQPRPLPPKPVAPPPAPEAPMAMDVAPEKAAERNDDVPLAPAAEIVSAFANRRSAAIAAATAGTTKQASAAAPKVPSVGPAPVQRPTVARPSVARPAPASARDTLPFPAKANGSAVKAPPGKMAKPGGASVTAAGIMGARRERNVVALPTSGTPEEQAAAARRAAAKPPTGLGSRTPPIKGKPRYLGLILTALLLILLVAVAAWASFFMGATDTTGSGAGSPTTTAPTASLSEPDATTSAETQTAVTNADASKAGDAQIADTKPADTKPAQVAPDATAAANPGTDPAATVAAGAKAASGRVAATGLVAPIDTAVATEAALAPATAQPLVDQTGTAAISIAVSTSGTPPQQQASNGPVTPAAPSATASVAATQAAQTAAAPVAAAPVVEPAPKTEVSTVGVPAVMPSTTVQDKIVLTMADLPPKPVGPIALPAAAAGADASPAAEPPPPPYGTVYKFDADGRIIPTPEGILTPEGVLLIAGKPKLAPPVRPAELSPVVPAGAAQATPADRVTDPAAAAVTNAPSVVTSSPAAAGTDLATQTPAAVAAPATLAQDPSLAKKRPQDKPSDLAPASDQQGAVEPLPQDIRLASLHPAARPKDLAPSPLAPDTGADAQAASASLAANGFALSSSLKPAARPSGLAPALDRAVDTAVVAALKEPEPETQVALNDPAPEVQPEVQDEPEIEAPAPNMPTNASVAKQATIKRAINTNKLALLAVFGTPSTRFAMIRQGNGAVKKIKVGDTVDGGRVAAITANSVQYQKGGRIVTLSLPTG